MPAEVLKKGDLEELKVFYERLQASTGPTSNADDKRWLNSVKTELKQVNTNSDEKEQIKKFIIGKWNNMNNTLESWFKEGPDIGLKDFKNFAQVMEKVAEYLPYTPHTQTLKENIMIALAEYLEDKQTTLDQDVKKRIDIFNEIKNSNEDYQDYIKQKLALHQSQQALRPYSRFVKATDDIPVGIVLGPAAGMYPIHRYIENANSASKRNLLTGTGVMSALAITAGIVSALSVVVAPYIAIAIGLVAATGGVFFISKGIADWRASNKIARLRNKIEGNIQSIQLIEERAITKIEESKVEKEKIKEKKEEEMQKASKEEEEYIKLKNEYKEHLVNKQYYDEKKKLLRGIGDITRDDFIKGDQNKIWLDQKGQLQNELIVLASLGKDDLESLLRIKEPEKFQEKFDLLITEQAVQEAEENENRTNKIEGPALSTIRFMEDSKPILSVEGAKELIEKILEIDKGMSIDKVKHAHKEAIANWKSYLHNKDDKLQYKDKDRQKQAVLERSSKKQYQGITLVER